MFIGTLLDAEPGQHVREFFSEVIQHERARTQHNLILWCRFNDTILNVSESDTVETLSLRWIDERTK